MNALRSLVFAAGCALSLGLGHLAASAQTIFNNGTTVAVTSVATATSLLAANSVRKGVTISNDSTAILYVGFGTDVSSSKYWVAIAAKGTVALTATLPLGYLGPIYGVWASANGSAMVTEFQ